MSISMPLVLHHKEAGRNRCAVAVDSQDQNRF